VGARVMEFDVEQRKVVSMTKLFDVVRDPEKHVWRGPTLRVGPSGEVYGDLEGKLFRLDPKTKSVTILREKDAGLTTIDRDGTVYFRDRINLWQYVP